MVALAAAVLLQAASPPPPTVPIGEIADAVPCASNPKFTYALYLPRQFTRERPWPILYAFDPRSRGKLAAALSRGVAERRGFILASSNDTESDNPKAPNAEAIDAVWNYIHERLRIDAKRVYAAGFSGGARFACALGLGLKGGLSGVIAVGGGFPVGYPPRKGLPFAVFGTVGTRDFNYYEMRELDATLDKLGVSHRLEIWEGEHDWPPAALAVEAVAWMDLLAMKRGNLAREDGFVAALQARQVERASAPEAAGRSVEAVVLYEALARNLDGFADVTVARASAARLRRAGAEDELKRRVKLDRRDVSVNNKNDGILETARSGEELPPLARLLNDLDVARLLKLAKEPSYDGQSAERFFCCGLPPRSGPRARGSSSTWPGH